MYSHGLITARPNYVTRITPRFDPVSRSGVIRGTAPIDMKQTAVTMYPVTDDSYDTKSNTLLYQYNLLPSQKIP